MEIYEVWILGNARRYKAILKTYSHQHKDEAIKFASDYPEKMEGASIVVEKCSIFNDYTESVEFIYKRDL